MKELEDADHKTIRGKGIWNRATNRAAVLRLGLDFNEPVGVVPVGVANHVVEDRHALELIEEHFECGLGELLVVDRLEQLLRLLVAAHERLEGADFEGEAEARGDGARDRREVLGKVDAQRRRHAIDAPVVERGRREPHDVCGRHDAEPEVRVYCIRAGLTQVALVQEQATATEGARAERLLEPLTPLGVVDAIRLLVLRLEHANALLATVQSPNINNSSYLTSATD